MLLIFNDVFERDKLISMPGLEPRLEPGLLMNRTGVRIRVLNCKPFFFFFPAVLFGRQIIPGIPSGDQGNGMKVATKAC